MALGELKNGIGPDAYAIYQQVLAAVVERDHPVGSLYISDNATSPAELYGGTWERIEGKFIMGASDTYPAGSTGGSSTHTQDIGELPSINGFLTGILSYTDNQSNGVLSMVEEVVGIESVSYVSGGGHKISTLKLNVGNNRPMNILNPYYSMHIWRRVA